jgi:hypothetical protein
MYYFDFLSSKPKFENENAVPLKSSAKFDFFNQFNLILPMLLFLLIDSHNIITNTGRGRKVERLP